MLQYLVPKPDLDAQKRVSSLLRSLDESITALQQQNTALESIAQRLFRSWFVNFDPVHAKAAGNEPEGQRQACLWDDAADEAGRQRSRRLMGVLDEVNARFGRGAVQLGALGTKPVWMLAPIQN